MRPRKLSILYSKADTLLISHTLVKTLNITEDELHDIAVKLLTTEQLEAGYKFAGALCGHVERFNADKPFTLGD